MSRSYLNMIVSINKRWGRQANKYPVLFLVGALGRRVVQIDDVSESEVFPLAKVD